MASGSLQAQMRSPWQFLWTYRPQLWLGAGMLLLTNACALGIPYSLGRAIDAMTTANGRARLWCLIMIGCALATAASRVASRLLFFHAARSAEYDLRSGLFGHLLRLDGAYFRAHPTGEVMSRMTSDVQTVRAMWGAGLLNLANTFMVLGSVLAMMLRIDATLTIWAILPYPVIYMLGRMMGGRIYRASAAAQSELGQLSAHLQEDLTSIAVIKSYTLEPLRRRAFATASERVRHGNLAVARTRLQLEPMLRALSSGSIIIALWVGGHAVLGKQITLGELFEFFGYLAQLVWPVLALGWMLGLVQRGKGAWSRLDELLRTAPAIKDGPASLAASAVPAAIEARDLQVSHDGQLRLHGVNAIIPAGSVTAIVGATGSGKSTFVDALARLVDVPRGALWLDGQDLTSLALADVRGAIGYAPQDAFLFSTSIAENIAMGLPDTAQPNAAQDPRVLEAAARAGLTSDLAGMPAGLETIVGERGITLSGGQRQRVALARALAASPRLLILDDSLAAVDANTEQRILSQLRTMRGVHTILLVSHRLAAIQEADQILVFADGTIVERGTHAALIQAQGAYARLYEHQLVRPSRATELAHEA